MQIDFYRLVGYGVTHFVDTDDRGDAARQVMGKYVNGELRCPMIDPREKESQSRSGARRCWGRMMA